MALNGGAIYISNPNVVLEVRGSTFSFNTASVRGGAVYIEDLENDLYFTRDGMKNN